LSSWLFHGQGVAAAGAGDREPSAHHKGGAVAVPDRSYPFAWMGISPLDLANPVPPDRSRGNDHDSITDKSRQIRPKFADSI
jgi:hypothetical protein